MNVDSSETINAGSADTGPMDNANGMHVKIFGHTEYNWERCPTAATLAAWLPDTLDVHGLPEHILEKLDVANLDWDTFVFDAVATLDQLTYSATASIRMPLVEPIVLEGDRAQSDDEDFEETAKLTFANDLWHAICCSDHPTSLLPSESIEEGGGILGRVAENPPSIEIEDNHVTVVLSIENQIIQFHELPPVYSRTFFPTRVDFSKVPDALMRLLDMPDPNDVPWSIVAFTEHREIERVKFDISGEAYIPLKSRLTKEQADVLERSLCEAMEAFTRENELDHEIPCHTGFIFIMADMVDAED